jgi:hypothetical protein
MGQLIKKIQNTFDSGWDVSSLPAYIDETQEELITRQVHEARTLGVVNVQEGVKGKQDLHLLDDEIIFQDGSDCTLEPNGDTVLGRRTIETAPIAWMKGFCNNDLNGFWAQVALRSGAANQLKDLPFEAAITNYLLQLNAFEVDKLLWQGDTDLSTGNLQFIDGFIKLLDSSGAVVEGNTLGATSLISAGTSGTAINIYDALFNMFEQASDNMGGVAESDMFKMYMGRENFNKLVKAYINRNWYHYNPDAVKTMTSIDLVGTNVTIEILPGLNGTNKIYGGKANHMTVGTDLRSDSDSYEMWYDQTDDKIYVRSRFRLGVQVPYLNECVKFTLDGSGS